MKLIGSNTSPYVRRLRLWLEGINYEFAALNIFEGEGRDTLKSHNPALRVPMLINGDQHIFDSRVIFRYLSHKLGRPALTWDQENSLTVIDAANDTFVSLLLLSRSGVDIDQQTLFFNLQHERVERTMTELDAQVADGKFETWDYPAICLFCLVDWVMFRDLYDFTRCPNLQRFHSQYQHQEGVSESDPRQG